MEFSSRVHFKCESMPIQTRPPQQEIFIEWVVIGDLDFGVGVEDCGDGKFVCNDLFDVSGHLQGRIPFQQILLCLGGHPRRKLLRVE